MKTTKNFLTIAAAMFIFGSMTHAAENAKSQGATEKHSVEMMNNGMTEMQKEMDQIKSTKDPKQKQALLDKHMKTMQAQMDMMGQSMKGPGMMGKNQQGMMNQMGEMHGMMSQMMGQMQEHMKSCPMNQESMKK
jgi:hypothetical protein